MASSQLFHLTSAWYADSCQNKAATLQQIVAATVRLYNLVCDECRYSFEPLSLFTVWTVKEEGGECTEEEWGQEEE